DVGKSARDAVLLDEPGKRTGYRIRGWKQVVVRKNDFGLAREAEGKVQDGLGCGNVESRLKGERQIGAVRRNGDRFTKGVVRREECLARTHYDTREHGGLYVEARSGGTEL